MIKKLKRKVTRILTGTLFLILLLSLTLLNGYEYRSYEGKYREKRILSEKKVRRLFRNNVTEDKKANVIKQVLSYENIYTLVVDDQGQIIYSVYDLKEQQKLEMTAKTIWNTREVQTWLTHVVQPKQGKNRHFYGNIWGNTGTIRFKVSRSKGGFLISYYDKRSIYHDMQGLLICSAIAAIVGFFVLFLIAGWLTIYLIKPVEESYYRQKRFIADASHELKTPLAVIGVNMDMLIKNPENPKYMYYLQQERRKMNQLIDELLVMAAIDEEEERITKELLEISDVVEGAIEPFEAVAYEQGVSLQTRIERGIFYFGNADNLQRLVGILLDNAIKHADFEKKVEVSLQKEKNNIVLLVCNTGKDIPKEEQKKIFERFYRVDKARSRGEGRYGLGLSIAKSIVQQHKGKIQVTSGHGSTCFRVTFFRKRFQGSIKKRNI